MLLFGHIRHVKFAARPRSADPPSRRPRKPIPSIHPLRGETTNTTFAQRRCWQTACHPPFARRITAARAGPFAVKSRLHPGARPRICRPGPMKTNAANGSREPAGVTTLSNDLQRDTYPANGSDIEMSASILNEAFKRLDPIERLVSLHDNVRGSVVFTTSFGLEDQALTHLIAEAGIDCRFATLDTGRLFPETYAVWAETEQRYGIRVEAFYPRAGALQALVQQNGVNGFYHSTEARHACCAVRKIEPLGRTLEGAAVWLTGLRADQSGNRQRLDFVSYETDRRLLKASPLLDWSRDRVAALVRDHDVPATPCMTKASCRSAAPPAPERSSPGSRNAPDAGGGNRTRHANAVCM